MAQPETAVRESHFGATQRRDIWWVEILPVVLLLGGFGVYTTFRAFEGAFYEWGPYLSPFYSPLIDPKHTWWRFSPALLILGGPLAFRATCYYYRKAYYRAFFLDPASCAVGERHDRRYKGETSFPFLLQNAHRYFFFVATIFLAFLWYDAVKAFFYEGHFRVGVGSLVLLVNIVLLSLYSLSCHSLRHLAGGGVDCFSCVSFGKTRRSLWRGFSALNEHHMFYAWVSLISVGLTDFYVRSVACGYIRDITLL